MGSIEIAPDHHFEEREIRNNDFNQEPDVSFCFVSTALILAKLKGRRVEYSFNGNTVHGAIDNRVKSISMDTKSVSKIWFRKIGPVAEIRVDAWIKAVT